MRISDWSSDVCSSDLRDRETEVDGPENHRLGRTEGNDIHMIQRHCGADRCGHTRNQALALHRRLSPGRRLRPAAFLLCVLGMLDHKGNRRRHRSEEHTSELQSLMRISYAVFCLKQKNINTTISKNT